jgi:hypothetical protein
VAFIINCIPHFHIFPCRCQGCKKDLDGELSKYPRSREFTEELVKNLPVMTLWKNFGIIPDVVVCSDFFPVLRLCRSNHLSLYSHLQTILNLQTSMNS